MKLSIHHPKDRIDPYVNVTLNGETECNLIYYNDGHVNADAEAFLKFIKQFDEANEKPIE